MHTQVGYNSVGFQVTLQDNPTNKLQLLYIVYVPIGYCSLTIILRKISNQSGRCGTLDSGNAENKLTLRPVEVLKIHQQAAR